MKKLMTLALGMTLTFGTAAAVFGQEPPSKPEKGKKAPKQDHKGGKKSKKGSGSTTPPPK